MPGLLDFFGFSNKDEDQPHPLGLLAQGGPAPVSQASPPVQATPSIGDFIGKLYGGGGPGDALITLGANIAAAPRNDIGRGLASGLNAINQQAIYGQARDYQKAQMQQKLQALQGNAALVKKYMPNATDQEIAAIAGNPTMVQEIWKRQNPSETFKQETDAEGNVWQTNSLTGQRQLLKTSDKENAQLKEVRLPDGSTQQMWVRPGESQGTPVGAPTTPGRWAAPSDLPQVQPTPRAPVWIDPKGQPHAVGAPLVDIGSGQTEEEKKLGELNAKAIGDMRTSGDAAPMQISKLNQIERLLGGVKTGALADTQAELVRYGKAFGLSDDTIKGVAGMNPAMPATKQALSKIVNEMTVGMIGPGGFPANNFSDADRKFLSDVFPKLANEPEANQFAIEVLRRVEQKKADKLAAWDQYSEERADAGKRPNFEEFDRLYRKKVKGENLFGGITEATIAPISVGGSTIIDGVGIKRLK